MELLMVFCTLTIVVLGFLVMTQVVSLDDLGKGIGRLLLVAGLASIAFWATKVIVLPILFCGLVWLKRAMLRTLIALLSVLGIVALIRLAFVRVARESSSRRRLKEKDV